MAISTYVESSFFEGARKTIDDLGGDFVGIQSPLLFDPIGEKSVIFTKKGSNTLLSIPVSKFTQDAVMEKLGKNVKSVQKVKFLSIAARLRGLADEIEEEAKNG